MTYPGGTKINVVLIAALLLFSFSLCKKKTETTKIEDKPPAQIMPCDSGIEFYPEEISGTSPLAVTYYANFKAVNSDGITLVSIDFGNDGFIDENYSYDTTPQNSFSYNAVYSSVGEFKDTFYFFWTEKENNLEKNCKAKRTSKAKVTFFCPKPSIEVIGQIFDDKTRAMNIWIRPTNMSLEQVTFYAGYDTLNETKCTIDSRFQNTCFLSLVAPEFGDWNLCWYAQSFCGNKTDVTCVTFIASYSFSEIFQYEVGKSIAFDSFASKMVAVTPPYITLISPSGDVVTRLTGAYGDIRWIKLTEEGIWLLDVRDKFHLRFVDFFGKLRKEVVNPENTFGTIAFDIYKTQTKRYTILLRSFQERGEILVFDISSFDASEPVCKMNIPAGARMIRFINGYAFVGYIDRLLAYGIRFKENICEFDTPSTYAFKRDPSLFDIEGSSSSGIIAVYASDAFDAKGKLFAFGFNVTDKSYFNIGDFQVTEEDVDVLSIKVSPFELSHIAILYHNKKTGEYRIKLFDLQARQSIGGVEGLKVQEKPTYISFLGKMTAAVVDEKNRLNIMTFPEPTPSVRTKSIGGFRDPLVRTQQIIDINCNTGESYIFIPDGGGIVGLDITPVLSPAGGFPSIATYIAKDSICIQKGADGKIYGIFNEGGELYLSDTDFSFSSKLNTADITTFSVGLTYAVAGGRSGAAFAKRTFSSFMKLPDVEQLRKSIYLSPFFFLFTGNRLHVFNDELRELLNITMDCQDIAVSDDGAKIFCLNPLGISVFAIDRGSISNIASRRFLLPIGNVYDSDFEDDHILFLSDLTISKGFGIIRTKDLKIVLLSVLPEEVEPISISAKKHCLPNLLFVSAYGNFPYGGIAKGWLVRVHK